MKFGTAQYHLELVEDLTSRVYLVKNTFGDKANHTRLVSVIAN